MKFADPFWLLAGLIFCGLLSWTWYAYDRRQRAALAVFASSHLHAQLTASVSLLRRRWKRGLFLASIALLFIALARPQAGFQWQEFKRRGIEILFAIDTSKSMLTPDVKPNRLTRAKLAIDDFVSHLNGDGVGLVAFAGNAFLQCPITLDYDAFNESLDAIDTDTIPRGGTDISSAIREAQAALQNRGDQDKILILLTDGEDLEGSAVDTAKDAAKSGMKIYTVGVGTTNGDLIPLPPGDAGGDFVKDDSGQFVKSHLDETTLKAIAAATGGLYAPLGAQGQGLDTIYRDALAPLAQHDLASRRQRVYIEQYQWPLAAAFLLLLASVLVGTRRNPVRKRVPELPSLPRLSRKSLAPKAAMALLGFALVLSSSRAQASIGGAESAYQKGDFETAQREYAEAAQHHSAKNILQFDAGTAAYKAGHYAEAMADFKESLGGKESADPKQIAAQQDAYYNLGNTLYRTGQKADPKDSKQTIDDWEQAIKSYDAALQLRADDGDAQFNRDLVQKKLDALKKQQPPPSQQQKQDQSKQDQQKQDQKNQQSQSGQGSPDKNQQQDPQNQQNPQNQNNSGNQTAQSKPNEGQGQQKPDNSGQQNRIKTRPHKTRTVRIKVPSRTSNRKTSRVNPASRTRISRRTMARKTAAKINPPRPMAGNPIPRPVAIRPSRKMALLSMKPVTPRNSAYRVR